MRLDRLIRSVLVLLAVLVVLPRSARADMPAALSAQTLKLPTGPSGIKGLGESFTPDVATGSGSFSIPLEVPPAALAPALAIKYTAGRGRSALGLSFDLPVLHIYRTTDKGSPGFLSTDRFAVSGGLNDELTFVGEQNGIRYYRLKNEGAFAQLSYDGSRDEWVVRQPNGETLELGGSANAREYAGSGVARWYVRRHRDRFGRSVEYAYRQDGGKRYIETITYQADEAALLSRMQNTIRFDYASRPDVFTDYAYGAALRTALRMTRVTMEHGGELVRRYLLDYQNGELTSLLRSVTMEGRPYNGAVSRMPELTFSYLDPSRSSGLFVNMYNPPGDLELLTDGGATLEDVNGDGLPDLLVGTTTGGFKYYENQDGLRWAPNATRLYRSPDTLLNEPGALLADMDGDGLRDLVHSLSETEYEYFPGQAADRGRTEAFGDPVLIRNDTLDVPFTSPAVKLFDANSDGRTDLLWSAGYVLLNKREFDGRARLVAEPAGPIPNDVPFEELELVDWNGDGLLDLVHGDFGSSSTVRVWYSLGQGRFADRPVTMGNVPAGWSEDFRFVDVNRDGQTDLVQFDGTALRWLPNNGAGGFGAPRGWFRNLPSVGSTRQVTFADMNGNGTQDVVWLTQDYSVSYLDLTGEPNAGLLSTIENGLGLKTQLSYRSSTSYAIEARKAKKTWRSRLPHPVPVLSSIETTDSLDLLGSSFAATKTRTTFDYADGYYDGREREFRGFARVVQTEHGDVHQPTLVTETRFHVGRDLETGLDQEILKGKPLFVEQRSADGLRISTQQQAWVPHWLCRRELGTALPVLPDCNPTSTQNAERKDELVAFAVAKATLSGSWEKKNSPRFSLTELEHDAFGKPTKVSNWGEVTLSGNYVPGGLYTVSNRLYGDDELIEETDFLHNLEQWLIGYAYAGRKKSGSGQLLSATRSFYDDPDADKSGKEPALATSLTHGLLTVVQAWLTEEQRWVPVSRTRYRRGQPEYVEDATGRRTRFELDAGASFFVVAEHVIAGNAEAPRELVYRAEYDFGRGAVVSLTDPNGQTSRVEYDGLGRVTGIVDPLGDLVAEYDYDYGRPLSTTTVRTLLDREQGVYSESVSYTDGAGRARLQKELAEAAYGLVASGFAKYSARGSVIAEFEPFRAQTLGFEAAPAATEKVRTRYDELGRVVAQFGPSTAELRRSFSLTSDFVQVMEKQYAPFSEVMLSERDVLERGTAAPGKPAPLNAGTETQVDGLGRVRRVERLNPTAEGVQTLSWQLGYDARGLLTSFADPKHTRNYRYDALGRLRRLEDKNLGALDYTYDDAGRLQARVDALGQTQRWSYDLAGRVNAHALSGHATRPDEVFRFHYDVAHPELAAHVKTQDTNLLGRVSWMEFPTGISAYSYDHEGRADTEVTQLWNPELGDDLTDLTLRDTYVRTASYDVGGRLIASREGDRGDTPEFDGLEVSRQYNERSLLSSVSARLNGKDYKLFSNIAYEVTGLPYASESGNNLRSCRGYDERRAVQRSITGTPSEVGDCRNLAQSGTRGLHNLSYAWTYDGNLAAIEDLSAKATGVMRLGAAFSYDSIGQLTAAAYEEPALRSQRYSYDEVQNLVSKVVLDPQGNVERATRYFFDEGEHPSPQRLARVQVGQTQTSLSYDAVGQLKALDGAALGYDVLGNLVSATLQGGTQIEHHFDAAGDRRITVVRDAQGKLLHSERLISDQFSIRDGDEIWSVSSSLDQAELRRSTGLRIDNSLIDELRLYVHNGGRAAGLKQPLPDEYLDLNNDNSPDFDAADLALAEAAEHEPVGGPRVSVRYTHSDHLGSATHTTTASGALISQQVFLAYGELAARSGTEPLQGFTGMRRDLLDLGLVHMGAREYSPTLGRWLTPDRYIGESPRLMVDKLLQANLYAYARGNPARFVDPSGTEASRPWYESAAIAVGDAIGLDNIETAGNLASGVADAAAFGMVAKLQEKWGIGEVVERDSSAYQMGQVGYTLLSTAAGLQGAAQMGTALANVVNAGRGGMALAVAGSGTTAAAASTVSTAAMVGGTAGAGFGSAVLVSQSRGGGGRAASPGQPSKGALRTQRLDRLVQTLRNTRSYATRGNYSARGMNSPLATVTRQEAQYLGRKFVGPGYTESTSSPGMLISKDGLRLYRPPTAKPGSPFSGTGVQANFVHRVQTAEGGWTHVSNGHVDVIP